MKYDLRLNNNTNINDVESALPIDILLMELRGGLWLTDEYGWRINPAHITMIRPVEDEDA